MRPSPAASSAEDPFVLPRTSWSYPARTHDTPRTSLRDVLPYFEITPTEYGRRLIERWDEAASDAFYLRGVQAIGGWLDFINALSMPIRIPDDELAKPRSPADPAFIEMQHHAYLEATLTLGDSIAAGLAGYPRPAAAMIRPFVEMAVTEVYVHGDDPGKRLWAYLRYLAGTGHRPRYGPMLDAIFAEPRFTGVASFRDRVNDVYRAASTSMHVHTAEEGLLHMRDANRARATYPEVVFWFASLGLAVRRMLTLLTLRNPMTLFPVDVRRRFGYGGPMNLFADEVMSASIADGLGTRHAQALRGYLADDPDVTSLLSYYQSQPVLSDADLDAQWDDFVSRSHAAQSLSEMPAEARWAVHQGHIATSTWALDMSLARRLIPELPNFEPSDTIAQELIATELRPFYPRPR